MPITKSAKKALRQSERRRERNLIKKKAYKNVLRKFHRFLAEKKVEEAKKLLPEISKKLDKAAKTNVIHKNKASRLKSRAVKALSRF